LNQALAGITGWVSQVLRYTQTGVLGWNVVGIILGLIFVLTFLAAGAGS
jgi:hypothetical protein